jgi:hypothetical protein
MCRRLARIQQKRAAYDKQQTTAATADIANAAVAVDSKTALQKEKEEFLKSLGIV